MERAKLANGKKTEPLNTKSARTPMKKTGSKPKAEKLVCRYCGSDDLAPSFVKRSPFAGSVSPNGTGPAAARTKARIKK
jgi:hypothetical protein